MYRHILIPTDGSELAGRAVRHGLALAKAVGAKVTALTVEASFDVSISAGMKRASSSGVLVHGVIARASILSWVSGSLMKAMSNALSLSMIGRGVPAGATTENQGLAA